MQMEGCSADLARSTSDGSADIVAIIIITIIIVVIIVIIIIIIIRNESVIIRKRTATPCLSRI